MQFVPQIIFLVLLFGYMGFMMFFKWVKYTAKTDFQPDTPGCAPSVLIMFINMMLFKNTPPSPGCEEYMYTVQPKLEMIFVLIAVICIPWLLLGKPLYIKFTRKNKVHAKTNGELTNNMEVAEAETPLPSPADSHGAGAHVHDDEPVSEMYKHQVIHTIEYILSTISHTASYLRLWALSLAHARKFEEIDYR